MKVKTQLYLDDLAAIHVEGYGFHWEQAADPILRWLHDLGISAGAVVDLGCGGGQWLRRLADHGYQTTGIDVSPQMIRIARKNSPSSQYITGSFADVDIPTCDVVTSLGEPLNYLNSGTAIKRTIRKVFRSLRQNGVFIFDVRHPANRAIPARDHNHAGKDWFCHARIEEDHSRGTIVRHITTFRKIGRGNDFRRDQETHRLKVFSRAQTTEWLRAAGFRVRTKRGYGGYQLADRQSVFICRKPKG